MQFIRKKRPLFDKKYRYKICTDCKVIWNPNSEKWLDLNDKKWMMEIKTQLQRKYENGKDYKIQGAVIYCRNLDVAYHVRMKCGEKVTKIEEAAVEEIEPSSIEDQDNA